MALGNSEKKVLAYLNANNLQSAPQIGEACYKESYWGQNGFYSIDDPEHAQFKYCRRIRANWASKVLRRLKKRGLISRVPYKQENGSHVHLWFIMYQEQEKV